MNHAKYHKHGDRWVCASGQWLGLLRVLSSLNMLGVSFCFYFYDVLIISWARSALNTTCQDSVLNRVPCLFVGRYYQTYEAIFVTRHPCRALRANLHYSAPNTLRLRPRPIVRFRSYALQPQLEKIVIYYQGESEDVHLNRRHVGSSR